MSIGETPDDVSAKFDELINHFGGEYAKKVAGVGSWDGLTDEDPPHKLIGPLEYRVSQEDHGVFNEHMAANPLSIMALRNRITDLEAELARNRHVIRCAQEHTGLAHLGMQEIVEGK